MIITMKSLYKIKRKKRKQNKQRERKEENGKEVKRNPKREQTFSVQVRKRIQGRRILLRICLLHNLS